MLHMSQYGVIVSALSSHLIFKEIKNTRRYYDLKML